MRLRHKGLNRRGHARGDVSQVTPVCKVMTGRLADWLVGPQRDGVGQLRATVGRCAASEHLQRAHHRRPRRRASRSRAMRPAHLPSLTVA